MMDFWKKEYPEISDLYFDYIGGEEYNQLKTTKYTSKVISKITTKAQSELADDITNACCDCKTAGFILGFSYALKLMSEAKSALEVVK